MFHLIHTGQILRHLIHCWLFLTSCLVTATLSRIIQVVVCCYVFLLLLFSVCLIISSLVYDSFSSALSYIKVASSSCLDDSLVLVDRLTPCTFFFVFFFVFAVQRINDQFVMSFSCGPILKGFFSHLLLLLLLSMSRYKLEWTRRRNIVKTKQRHNWFYKWLDIKWTKATITLEFMNIILSNWICLKWISNTTTTCQSMIQTENKNWYSFYRICSSYRCWATITLWLNFSMLEFHSIVYNEIESSLLLRMNTELIIFIVTMFQNHFWIEACEKK